MKRLLLLGALVVAAVAFFASGYDDYLTLGQLKASQTGFQGWLERSPVLVSAAFFVFYVLMTTLSLPGGAVMSIAAGALFGLWLGTLLVSFASTAGATLAFLLGRFLFRDSIQARFGKRLKSVNEGVRRDGAFYLFTLRLIPVFPFFVINLVMALTPLRTWTYYWVSQLGMLPGTFVFINAGTQLADIERVSDILSLELLLSFALIGLFPWIAKGLVAAVRRGRAYSGWQRPKSYDRNLIVIGAGSAGLVSAYIGATVNAKVTLIEADKMGGDCLNYGCVPSKALIKSARVAQQFRQADRYGLEAGTPRFSFRAIMQRVHSIIAQVEPHDSVERYTNMGVDVLEGHARIVDPWTVEVALSNGDTRRLTTRAIVIAAGASPVVPPLPGIEDSGYVTSDTLWERFAERDEPPRRLVVLGGGPIGCELSQAFARLGSEVVQVERGERIMPREDTDISELARQSMEADGVRVLTGHTASRIERESDLRFVVVEQEGREERLEYDELLVAVGRAPRLTGYGLEDLGIPTQQTVVTNEYLQAHFPNIYAAGDVAGPYQFTHAAAHTAWYASVNALFGQFKKFKVDYSIIPWTTFTDPEVARVGLNEQEARERDIDYEVTRYELSELDRAITESDTNGLIKVLTVPGKDKILGATLVGSNAGELLAEFVLAMKHGLGLNKILGTIHTYPTLVEANKYAAGEWKRAHAPGRLLEWVGRYHQWRRGGGKA